MSQRALAVVVLLILLASPLSAVGAEDGSDAGPKSNSASTSDPSTPSDPTSPPDPLSQLVHLERSLATASDDERGAILAEAARLPWPLTSESLEEALVESRSQLPPDARRTWALDRALPMLHGELEVSDEVLADVLGELKEASLAADDDLLALQEARKLYAGGDAETAATRYADVTHGAGLWPEALRERAWALVLLGRPAEALGATVSLSAPYFALEEHSEGRLLRALVFLERCRFGEARTEVASLADIVLPAIDEAQVANVLIAGAPEDSEFWQRALASPLVARARRALQLAGATVSARMDGGSGSAATFTSSGVNRTSRRMDGRQGAEIDNRRNALESLAIRLLGDAARAEREALRGLKERALRLRYETLRSERALLESGLRPITPRAPVPELLDDDDVAWNFDGVYWRDEVGAYRYAAGDACPRRESR